MQQWLILRAQEVITQIRTLYMMYSDFFYGHSFCKDHIAPLVAMVLDSTTNISEII